MYLRILSNYLRIKNNQWLDKKELERMQWRAFKHILNHAYNNVPFYHEKFKKAGIKPEHIKEKKDILKIPITTKEELQLSGEKILAKGFDKNNCFKSKTSGSTGRPFTSYFDKNSWAILKYASKLRARRACGLRMGDRIVNIEAYSKNKIKNENKFSKNFISDRLFKKRIISVFDNIDNHIAFYKKFKPDILYGFGSYFNTLANYMENNNIEGHKPKIIFTSAEMLDRKTKNKLKKKFNAEVYDVYGSTELKEVAWECPQQKGYHINDDLYLVEFIKENRNVDNNEVGEIVVTSLVNMAMPLIRYNTKDTGSPSRDNCSCGRSFSLMKPMQGRSVDYFTLPNKRKISPYTLTSSIENINGILQYQIIQKTRNKVLVNVVLLNKYPANLKNQIILSLKKVLGRSISIQVKIVKKLDNGNNGKFKIVKSELK